MDNTLVADVTLYDGDGIFCFVPLEGDLNGEHSLILGMNYIATKPPREDMKVVGIVHMDGDEALTATLEKFPEIEEKLKAFA